MSRIVEWCLRHPLSRRQWLVAVVWLGLLGSGMIALGGHIGRTVNTEITAYDQSAYLPLVEESWTNGWPAATDGTRNPLFPWLVARLTHGSPDAMFEAGKRLNLWCGAFFAVALGVWAGRRMGWLPAMTLATVCGLGVILPISTFAGAETLAYPLAFAAWSVTLDLLERLTFRRCAVLGGLLALGYLAKPSVSLFCASLGAAALVRWFVGRREAVASGWSGARLLGGVALTFAVAIPIILPRAVNAQRQFGDPLQNTSAILFWEEDWAAARPHFALLNPRKINQIPAADRPSAGRYFARNGWRGAWERLTRGMALQGSHIFPIRRYNFSFTKIPSPEDPTRRIFAFRGYVLLVPLVLAIGLSFMALRRFGSTAIPRHAWCQAAFIGLLFGLSFAAFGWYAPIAPGARFILTLYIPMLASLFWAVEALRRRLAIRWLDPLCAGIWVAMLGVFLLHMGVIATHPYFGTLRSVF